MQSSDELIARLRLISHPEGGYFIETHRSGSTPMSTKGQTDVNVPTCFKESLNQVKVECTDDDSEKNNYEALTIAPSTKGRRPDGDIRRNCLTSIIWMPTHKSPTLPLQINLSDHVHYYQGGSPFQYFIYDPTTKELNSQVLGPNFEDGQKLQVVVRGGLWKCGKLLQDNKYDFCLIGEAVSPGFDFNDFSWVTKANILSIANKDYQHALLEFLHGNIDQLVGHEVRDSEIFYNE